MLELDTPPSKNIFPFSVCLAIVIAVANQMKNQIVHKKYILIQKVLSQPTIFLIQPAIFLR